MPKFRRPFLCFRCCLLVAVLLLQSLPFLSSNNDAILWWFPDGPILVNSWTIRTVVSDNPTRRLYNKAAATTAATMMMPTAPALAARGRLKSFASISSTALFSSVAGPTCGEETTNFTTSPTVATSTAATAATATRIATVWENPAAGNNDTEKIVFEEIEPERSLCQETSSEVKIHRLPGVRRIHCISDLHVDNADNLEWLKSKCQRRPTTLGTSYSNSTTNSNKWDETDLIVVAGDISHDTDKIEESLIVLRDTGAHVVFVPGNHEAWLTSRDLSRSQQQQQQQQQQYSSVTKLEDIEKICRKLGVYTTGECVCVGGSGCEASLETTKPSQTEEFWILPLDSWYDGSLSFVDLNDAPTNDESEDGLPTSYDLVRDFGKWPWVDFRECQWPSRLFEESAGLEKAGETQRQPPPPQRSRLLRKIPIGLVDYYLERNQKIIDAFHDATIRKPPTKSSASDVGHEQSESHPSSKKKTSVLTITHFLPNKQSLPDWKDLESPNFRIDSWLDHGAGGMSAKFALVGGSSKIDDQIRSLSLVQENSNNSSAWELSRSEPPRGGFHHRIHVFGHSHRPKDFVYEGIRYVHNPLGKPREREMHMVDPNVEIKLLWEAGRNTENETNSTETILRYWEERGGGLEMLLKRMQAQKRKRELVVRERRQRRQQQQQTSKPD